jgi:hypothetical protein
VIEEPVSGSSPPPRTRPYIKREAADHAVWVSETKYLLLAEI